MRNLYIGSFIVFFWSCEAKKEWAFNENLQCRDFAPLGVVIDDETLILSDPDNNRILRTDLKGELLKEWTRIQRPMHIDLSNGEIYLTEFINDRIAKITDSGMEIMELPVKLDAPAAIDIENNLTAIADFYSHKVYLISENEVLEIGGEGREDGKLYYPTDVKIYKDRIVVADAYNNRVQTFDFNGTFLKVIGWQEEINVASGVDVFEDLIYVTDFYNDRVLIYNFDGTLIKTLEGQFDQPTDVFLSPDRMVVANYGGKYISFYSR